MGRDVADRGDQPPPWEIHWWEDVLRWIERHPELAHQLPALERWLARLKADPMEVPSFLVPGDELGVRVSLPPDTDVLIGWQAVDWTLARYGPNRRIVYIRRFRRLDEPDELGPRL